MKNRMEKTVSLLMLLCMLFTLCACNTQAPKETEPVSQYATEDNVHISTEGMNDYQKAIVITAESYFLRGPRVQYDQRSYTVDTSRKVGRRTTMTRKVEDYTTQYFGYHDCSSFVFDVYWNALGIVLSEDPAQRLTKDYMNSPYVVISDTPEENGKAKYTQEELTALLEPGDIIVYRKPGNTRGHAMLYVGGDTLIHSSGDDYTEMNEKWEKKGTYYKQSMSKLIFDPASLRYLFGQHSYVVLRPLADYTGEIPAETVARLGDMRGIMAEKLSSHTYGQTVSPDGELSFTFRLENHSTADKTLQITETVPELTTYVSGADTVEGNTLKWEVTVPAGGEASVSYTVKVDADAPTGATILSESDVSGVAVNCPAITVAKTLTEEQLETLRSSFATHKEAEMEGYDLLYAVYKDVLGTDLLAGLTPQTLIGTIYEQWNDTDLAIAEDTSFKAMLVPRLYGGKRVVEKEEAGETRTRLLQEQFLLSGDLIISNTHCCMYLDGQLYDMSSGSMMAINSLEWFTGYFDCFVVLRPSMAT